jgi:hypothetical protein
MMTTCIPLFAISLCAAKAFAGTLTIPLPEPADEVDEARAFGAGTGDGEA